MKKLIYLLAVGALFASILASCGGSLSNTDNEPLVWDESNWSEADWE